MTTRFSISSFALAAAISLAGTAGTAWTATADDTDPMTDPPAPAKDSQGGGKKKRDDGGFLSGPSVPPGAAQGGGSFGSGDGKRQGGKGGSGGPGGFMTAMQDARMFREALGSVMADLTDDQRTQVETLASGFQTEVQEWRTKNADQIKQLEEAFRAMRGGEGKGARPGKDGQGKGGQGKSPNDGGAKPEGAKPEGGAGGEQRRPDPKMMEQMQALKATMPKFEPVREKIMAVLSADQQAAVKGALEKMRKKGGERGPGRDGKDGKGRDGAQGKAPPPADPPKGDYKFAE